MLFGDKHAFLVVHRDNAGWPRRVSVVPTQDKALRNWTRFSRISPIFHVSQRGLKSPDTYAFPGKKYLLFLGPVHPERLSESGATQQAAWLSLGLYNVVCVPATRKDLTKSLTYVSSQKIPFEMWDLRDGVIQDVQHWEPKNNLPSSCNDIACFSSIEVVAELREAVQEYCPLIATSIARSSVYDETFSDELAMVHALVSDIFEKLKSNNTPEARYVSLGQVLTTTSGLSRFASETFGGTSPIQENECQFWSHSLLGIGIGTFALHNVRRFLDKTLGAARLPERFAALKRLTKDVPDLCHQDPSDKDYLSEVALDDANAQPLIPLLVYFSARDGYRSTETTVSAPLATVNSCNSLRWSLLTLTHELSHVIIRAVQFDLYPDLTDDDMVKECLELLRNKGPADSLFSEIRKQLLLSVVKIDESASGGDAQIESLDANGMRKLLGHWRQEIDEIMVHTFDFLYFYGKDFRRYIAGIWASWGTIPNISSRVEEYVIRSICAVLATHLRRGQNAEDIAKEQVLNSLQSIQAGPCGGRYVDEAINCINDNWTSHIRLKVRARRQLVKIVNSFLFSEKIATAVRGEPEISGGASEREGYTLRRRHVELRSIRNPLRFLEIYTEAVVPNPVDSVWMLYVLAFCINKDD